MDHRSDVETVREQDPRGEYTRRLETSRVRLKRLVVRDDRLGNARLGLFLVAFVLAVLAWRSELHWGWLAGSLVSFLALVVVHGRVLADRRRLEGQVGLHERGLARLDGRWSGSGVPGTRFLDEEHLYSADLDLFGVGSLFERICLARTSMGESILASWLLAPAPPEEIKLRREAILELIPRLDLREDLAMLGDDVRTGGAPGGLAAWGSEPQSRSSPITRILIAGVSLAAVVSLIGLFAADWGPGPVSVAILIEIVIAYSFARRMNRALSGVEDRSGELETLAGLLARIERESFESPRLLELKAALDGAGLPGSVRIARLAGLVRWLEARHNVYFALFSSILLWKTQFGLAVEVWRAEEGALIARWLEAVGRFEAHTSMAGYAFENPGDPFPEIVTDGPVFEGEGIGHPLLADPACVRNDIQLGSETRVLAVSGSNMSGKSTWLRTIGINAVLAQAGGPVRARRLKLSPLAIGATLRVHDSLQAGRSRFYAEILRLKQLVELAKGSPPLLFLIDEVLHGTNSHDRLQGAEAVVRGLIDRGAIGLFTTHDLALAEVAGRLAPKVINVHFADHLDDSGQLAFDYRMQPGVVHQSNALALMRSVGLEV